MDEALETRNAECGTRNEEPTGELTPACGTGEQNLDAEIGFVNPVEHAENILIPEPEARRP
jgi:hypothetical protein